MTLITRIPATGSNTYTPRTINRTMNIPAGRDRVRITLTRESWPVGHVARIEWFYPNGDGAGVANMSGGDIQKKDGSGILTENVIEIRPQGNQSTMQAGTYSVNVVITQTVTTAITLERFP